MTWEMIAWGGARIKEEEVTVIFLSLEWPVLKMSNIISGILPA